MARPLCPRCSKEYVRRVSRVGLNELLLSLFYVYPFKCQFCGHRFKRLQWGVTYTRTEEDRREYERLSASFPLTFTAGTINGTGLAVDISMGGCTFHTETPLAEGSIVRMGLQLSSEVAPVDVEAAVIRNVNPGRTGVEFLRIENAERERLQNFVRGLTVSR